MENELNYLSQRVRSCLMATDIKTVKELFEYKDDLLKLRNFGKSCQTEVNNFLKKYNFTERKYNVDEKIVILVTIDELRKIITDTVNEILNDKPIASNSTPLKTEEEILTRKDVCKLLQIDSSTLWHWTNAGKVKAYGIANRRYYKRSEIMALLTK